MRERGEHVRFPQAKPPRPYAPEVLRRADRAVK